MKRVVLLGVVLALLGAGTANASYSLRYGPVKQLSELEARAICEHQEGCVAYGTSCGRRSLQRIDCWLETEDVFSIPPASVTEVCATMFHWFVSPRGELRHSIGGTHCVNR